MTDPATAMDLDDILARLSTPGLESLAERLRAQLGIQRGSMSEAHASRHPCREGEAVMPITTPEDLDEHRARAIDSLGGRSAPDLVRVNPQLAAARVRAADEALGISTDALLALINGEAVVVPSKETSE